MRVRCPQGWLPEKKKGVKERLLMKNIALAILLGLMFTLLLGLFCENLCLKWQQQELYEQGYRDGYNTIKTIKEFQYQIGCEKVDGKVCKMWNIPDHSETQEKWEGAIGQQCADVFINDYTMGIRK